LLINLGICILITVLVALFILGAINVFERIDSGQRLQISAQDAQLLDNNRKLEAANSERQQLLHILCHDLSNPFHALLSSMEIVESNPELFRKLLPDIKEAVAGGLGIIELVRKMRAVEEGKLALKIESVPLCEMFNESSTMLKNRFKGKEIRLEVSIDPSLTVSVDHVSFVSSVLNNLLTNAIKFSPRGSVILASATSRSDGKVDLSIRDHGIGMTDSILGSLFDLESNTTRNGTEGESGTGFGMHLVQKFVHAFGGEISVRSKDINQFPAEHGTEVTLTLSP
jgi:signal transduction histidine kinase